MKRVVPICVLLTGSTLFAQDTFWQPEVRRAIPVEKAPQPTPTPVATPIPRAEPVNPAWMQRVHPSPAPVATPAPQRQQPQQQQPFRPEPPTGRAVPFDNNEAPSQAPGPEPGFTPYRPTGRIEVAPTPQPTQPAPPAQSAPAVSTQPEAAPTPDEEGTIRLSPSRVDTATAAKQQLDRANAVYSRKMYDYAVMEYEKFLVSYSDAPGRDTALFRVAECHRMLGNDAAARAAYEKLAMEFRQGEFAGAGAYRLGEYLYAEKNYDAALRQFDLAAQNAAGDEIRLTAKYNSARCLEKLNRPKEAAAIYNELVAVEENNPYRDLARLARAETLAAGNEKKQAFEEYEKLATEKSSSPALRVEATVKAASLASELGQKEKAAELFEKALSLPEIGEWKPIALLGMVRINAALGQNKKLRSLPEATLMELKGEAAAEALLLVAGAHRQGGSNQQAMALYDRVIQDFPGTAYAEQARFQRVVVLSQNNDPKILQEIDKLLAVSKDPKERSQAALLKAEILFKEGKYIDAAPLYEAQLNAGLDESMKKQAFYKWAWSLSQAGNLEKAESAFSQYITAYPKDETLPSALLQRGLVRQRAKNYTGALADFQAVVENYPKSPEREFALQQLALIQGQKEDYAGMKASFTKLLEEYPKTAGAAQAHFWIGWAAFEEKNYPEAIKQLTEARELDKKGYANRATMRILLAYYYQEDREKLAREMAANPDVNAPVEVLRWLGGKSFEEGDYKAADKFLTAAAKANAAAPADIWIELAESRNKLGKSKEALAAAETFLASAREPYSRARALLAAAEARRGLEEYDKASALAEEALLLQPEGTLNAQGRLLTAEILFSRGSYEEAAKGFLTVAVLYDDKTLTPRALERAVDAYRKAGNLPEADKVLEELRERFPGKTISQTN